MKRRTNDFEPKFHLQSRAADIFIKNSQGSQYYAFYFSFEKNGNIGIYLLKYNNDKSLNNSEKLG